MHIASRLTSSLQEGRSARALLGVEHPFVRVVRRTNVVVERACVVGGLACVSGAALLDGEHGALAVLLASAMVELALLCNLAFLAPRRRDCARELIIEGRADLPLRAVQRERSRLRDPASRRALADGLEAIRETASRPVPSLPAARPMFHARVVAAVDPELAVIARRLRDEAAGTRGVAMAQRLLTDGCSPLYGGSVAALREELHRIMFLLGG